MAQSRSSEVARIETAAEKREERRRVSTLRNMQASLHSLTIEIENICSMGDAERAVALRRVKARFEFLGMHAESLSTESLELSEAAESAEYTDVTNEDLVADG